MTKFIVIACPKFIDRLLDTLLTEKGFFKKFLNF